MFLFKSLILAWLAIAPLEDGWVSVDRPERIVHRIEEEDRSIWVVFSKKFEDEHVLIRFPEDPTYTREEGRFEAIATHLGQGELTLLVSKRSGGAPAPVRDLSYRDADAGQWVQERHIETEQHHYILRLVHPYESSHLFHRFADSFELERR